MRYLRLGRLTIKDLVIGVLSLIIKRASNSSRATAASASLASVR